MPPSSLGLFGTGGHSSSQPLSLARLVTQDTVRRPPQTLSTARAGCLVLVPVPGGCEASCAQLGPLPAEASWRFQGQACQTGSYTAWLVLPVHWEPLILDCVMVAPRPIPTRPLTQEIIFSGGWQACSFLLRFPQGKNSLKQPLSQREETLGSLGRFKCPKEARRGRD